MLLVTWTSGTVLVSRGWGLLYALVLASVGLGLAFELDPYRPAGRRCAVLDRGGGAQRSRPPGPASSSPGSWLQALVVGVIGAGLGALLVTDHTIGWGFYGALPALALIPSAVGGLWGGRHLSRVHVELPRALRETPVARADKVDLRRPGPDDPRRIRRCGSTLGTAVLSAMCILVSPWTSGTIATSLFVGFGCLALATLFVSLLVSLGRMAWALRRVSAAVLVRDLDRAAGGARAAGQRPDRRRPDRVGRRTPAAGEALPAPRARARDGGLDHMTRFSAVTL